MSKRYAKFVALGLCLANLSLFAIFYVTKYLPSVRLLNVPDAVYYIFSYLSGVMEFCLAPLTAIIIFTLHYDDRKATVISSLLFSLPRAIYLAPYYYLYENALGNDSLESIGSSALITLGGVAFLFLRTFLLVLILNIVTFLLIKRRICRDTPYLGMPEKKAELKKEIYNTLPDELSKRSFTDIYLPPVAAIFTVSFIEFLYPLVNEIINTVSFFTKYKDGYTPEEVFSIVFSFLFILAELIVLHVLGILIKDLSLRMKTE